MVALTAIDPAHVVGTGGAIGALLRQYVSQAVAVEEYPLGTFAVNVLGSFVLALVAFGGVGGQLGLLLGTGLAGSFTTFSTFSYETVRLWETGERLRATVNAVSSIVGAVLTIGLARWLLAGLG
ncbi:integral membrane protein/CrcB-like protein [Halanaeroarchaeum sulfurireducens]|uniref:Fluoride-specific ion channel FluC n=1 Tax=Halanaeroarchaeum sulfurireducens TaxID=1604004 RepID=A0A0F7PBP3_9EURY|nr:integral membrane protein/CrcB-like protein [Halanaeroarchaeum sulfurireducens]ALG81465.1 integral membrane protein/CrcB-like protein [Halanaeroarchaeum sulfurireducens]